MAAAKKPDLNILPALGELSFYERIFLNRLRGLSGGSLELRFPSGYRETVGEGNGCPQALSIQSRAFFRKLLFGGSVGFGESYVEGDWEASDLSEVLHLFASNFGALSRIQRSGFNLERLFNRVRHQSRRNSRKKSRRNIEDHYDLSNEFYKTFLDDSMTYSCARFQSENQALEEAQYAKLDRMLELSKINQGGELLEIGSGWGSMALRAAQTIGCKVKSITLSKEQYSYADFCLREAGLSSKAKICLEDYRDQNIPYDAVVSCEMIEAVGKEYLDSYFAVIKRCLKPGSRAVIQVITIPDDRYKRYCRSCDWIQKHIFPGGHLPSPGALRKSFTKAGLSEVHMEAFGRDYTKTLQFWRNRFLKSADRIRSLGFGERFFRKWLYYFSYCEAGFRNGLIDVRHLVLENEMGQKTAGVTDHAAGKKVCKRQNIQRLRS